MAINNGICFETDRAAHPTAELTANWPDILDVLITKYEMTHEREVRIVIRSTAKLWRTTHIVMLTLASLLQRAPLP